MEKMGKVSVLLVPPFRLLLGQEVTLVELRGKKAADLLEEIRQYKSIHPALSVLEVEGDLGMLF
jgi:hypothetical protein